ncbi:hypothetical protein CspeluHIS016_0504640 [Cutaneotrichosporon spelunceum]|uniref:Transcription factor spt8 beta-propeller domain-containing protein n=1 Tax=Cutaneotrichosporon spelunceum TaxID=1672016 RepID=A0AAD3YDY5_9TREE|nr:hypothetical protein CspeluHIS016_0504640 [Cutaneotrichosporon spelunceum]
MRSDDEEDDHFEDEDEDEDEEMREDTGNQFDDEQEMDEDEDNAEGEEDEDGEDDEEEEEEEDEEEEDEDEDEDDDDDAAGDEEDQARLTIAAPTAEPSTQPSKAESLRSETRPPTPPHQARRSLFVPSQPWPPSNLTIETVVGIPLPTAVHSIATSTCLSYLLTGGQDGHVRAYDFWASVNGGQIMTAQQRSIVGLGEGVHKAGVGRGWWSCEVEEGAPPMKRTEPVYSLACEGDALWALAGSQSGPINLYTLRHRPGHLVHSLKGHTNVVSALQLLPGERGLLSGSWDGGVKEWDLNSGQIVRSYPTHGAQISSLSLRPITQDTDKVPEKVGANGDALPHVSVNVGPGFFKADREPDGDAVMAEEKPETKEMNEANGLDNGDKPAVAESEKDAAGEDDDADSLFDDDADGEDESKPATPALQALGLALPGANPPSASASVTPAPVPQPSAPSAARPTAKHVSGAAASIPLLTPTVYKTMSNDILLTSSMDGQVTLFDRREGGVIGRLVPGDRAPPWCMSAVWLGDGNQVLAGRRNGTIDIWDVRKTSSTATSVLRTLRTPSDSGPVSCIVAFPDGKHVATASTDNIRLWNTVEYYEPEEPVKKKSSRPPFRIIAGHHGGTISSMIVDATSRFLITASGDRGWQGESTRVVLVHEVKW